ncbi:hypothetical protein SAMN05428981_103201 [Bacillus sp. OV194]|nr:hypothetical protein SAMN05428981_103201 [Bacillus sp. OV194]
MKNRIIENKSSAKTLLQTTGSLLFIAGILGYSGKLSMPAYLSYSSAGMGILLTIASAFKK